MDVVVGCLPENPRTTCGVHACFVDLQALPGCDLLCHVDIDYVLAWDEVWDEPDWEVGMIWVLDYSDFCERLGKIKAMGVIQSCNISLSSFRTRRFHELIS